MDSFLEGFAKLLWDGTLGKWNISCHFADRKWQEIKVRNPGQRGKCLYVPEL